MTTELLKPIPGFPNYFATEEGKIFTIKSKGGNSRTSGKTREACEMRQSLSKMGYPKVSFYINGAVITQVVHRLVLLTFVGPPPEGMEGCHYPDDTKTNNRLSNLRWDSHDENIKDKVRGGGQITDKTCRRCLFVKPIVDFYKDTRSSDGAKTECKTCHSLTAKKSRDPEKKRAANREYMRRLRAR